jgi:hypothetical protein
VQAFLPSPMATATAMYHSGKNPLKRVGRESEEVRIPKGLKVRRLHKAFLRYHDANNWPVLREALRRMGRADLIGNGKHQLVPAWQPAGTGDASEGRRGGQAPTRDGRRGLLQTQPAGGERSGRRPASNDHLGRDGGARVDLRRGAADAYGDSRTRNGAFAGRGGGGSRASDVTGKPRPAPTPFRTQHTGLPRTPRAPGASRGKTNKR